ncbi:MAG: endopeptidase La [Kurthia sp.]|nr:endopeptidase La [Candidatus Kurthia equi]
MTTQIRTHRIPLLPLRGLIVYPHTLLHIDVGREKSIAAIEQAMNEDSIIYLVTQKEIAKENPTSKDFYSIGGLAKIKQIIKLPNGTSRVLVEGVSRAKAIEFIEEEKMTVVDVEIYEDSTEKSTTIEALMRSLIDSFGRYIKSSSKISPELIDTAEEIEDPGLLADTIANHLPLKMIAKQEILRTLDVEKRLEVLLQRISSEQEILTVEKKIHSKVKRSVEKSQKDFYLREQMKAIQEELGDADGKTGEVSELKKLIEAAAMPEHAEKATLKELKRYERLPAQAAESGVIRNYIDWMVALPWSKSTEDRQDIKKAQQILDEDHDGLEKVKERILEYLAVTQLKSSLRGPILCLAGPPGVGKTSLAKSVAVSLNREFVRASLGGVRDESEIRGHRRTYVGAMPGRIIQGMKKAGTANPVFLLDEIDKMSNDFRGDPSAAMLEVLDPEQNNSFSDHYIEEAFDLSNVLFIATANDLGAIPGPLRDRMEIIQIGGYTEQEKIQIAKNHLAPKQIKENGLKKSQLQFKEDALVDIVRYYTREAGVRGLERTLASVCRKAAKQIVMEEKKRITVTSKNVINYLGNHKFSHGEMEEENQVGVATGLAYTTVGGDTLQIEVSVTPGKGKIILTGKLGDVMKESAQTALSFVRSKPNLLKVEPSYFDEHDIHVHVPEGAVPKDGPSAGVTIVTALVSAITEIPIRKEVGMTGEVTLRGRVLPIGGLKEKSISAHRAGLKTIIIPKKNESDIEDIPESVRKELTFKLVSNADEVLKIALDGGN